MNNLTIAIPTYNRNLILKANLLTFLPYTPDNIKVLIIDNASKIPVSDTLKDVLLSFPTIDIKIIRNKENIFASANIVRCFLEANTKWVWVIGDEDTPLESSFKIFDKNKDNIETIFLGYSAENFCKIKFPAAGYGVDKFISSIENLSALLFISTGIYNRDKIKSHIGFGYHYAYSQVPHLAILLSAMQPNDRWAFGAEQIVRRGDPVDATQTFALYPIARGLSTIVDIQNIFKSRHILKKKLSSLARDFLRPEIIAFEMIALYYQKKENKPLEKYLSTFATIPKDLASSWYVLKYLLCLAILAFPDITIALIRMFRGFNFAQRLSNKIKIDQSKRM